MKGSFLNRERRNFLSSAEEILQDLLDKTRDLNYDRYDSYDDYQEEFSRNILKKFLDMKMQMINLLSELEQID